jgi:hypothetical protein
MIRLPPGDRSLYAEAALPAIITEGGPAAPAPVGEGAVMAGALAAAEFDVLGLGCVAVDDLLYVPEYPPPDAKVRVRRRERQCGGLTATALVAAARLGARCAYAGTLGPDADSEFVVECFRREGIDVTHLARRPDARPIHSTILVDEVRHTRNIFFDLTGSVGRGADAPPEEVLRATRVLYVDHYGIEGMTRAARVARPPASRWWPTWSATSGRASPASWPWSIT